MSQPDSNIKLDYTSDLFHKLLSKPKYYGTFLDYIHTELGALSKIHKIYYGVEFEFYLRSFGETSEEDIINKILEFDKLNSNVIVELKKEIGLNQFELILKIQDSAVEICNLLSRIKNDIKRIAKENLAFAYFHAKPFPDQPPSSLQFNLSFYDAFGSNILKNDVDSLNGIISGLLSQMRSAMIFFCPTIRCYDRIGDAEGIKQFRNSPCNVSCGSGENRTTALRIIEYKMSTSPEIRKKHMFQDKELLGTRIEHRVPSPSGDPYHAIIAISLGILQYFNLKNSKSESVPKVYPIIHENAFEQEFVDKYRLKALPKKLKIADDRYIYSDFRVFANKIVKDFLVFNKNKRTNEEM